MKGRIIQKGDVTHSRKKALSDCTHSFQVLQVIGRYRSYTHTFIFYELCERQHAIRTRWWDDFKRKITVIISLSLSSSFPLIISIQKGRQKERDREGETWGRKPSSSLSGTLTRWTQGKRWCVRQESSFKRDCVCSFPCSFEHSAGLPLSHPLH